MKHAGGVLFLAIVLAGAWWVYRTPERQDYNLVIFAFDGLQARHLPAYGYGVRNVTPNLDAFLRESYVFTNTVSAASWTVPSFMTMFTSLHPSEHKLTNKLMELETATGTAVVTANLKARNPGAVTLAEILKRNGFATAGFTGDAGVSGAFGYKDGFDVYMDSEAFGGFDGSIPPALVWLKEHKDERFFMFVHGYDVHGQHAPKDGFDYRYVPEGYSGPYTGSPKEQEALRERGLRDGTLVVSEADKEFWRAIYDEKINDADVEFAAFLGALEEEGVYNRTVVAVVSDHGTEFFEHGKMDHGHTLYGELLETLFAIHVPGREGRRVPDLVSTVDLTPTILGILDVQDEARSGMRGMDLTPSFSGKTVAHDAYSETDYRLYTHKRSVTTPDGWKFILTRESGLKELYDLTRDPGELKNLREEPRIAYELEQKLLIHLDQVGDRGPWSLGCLPVYATQCK
ncbi:MAG: sulfatase [Patescibacteria group bacterium]